MNVFEEFVLKCLDHVISSDTGLVVFLNGGFVLCGVLSLAMLTPWLRQLPFRFWLASGAALPAIVFGYAQAFDLLVQGRDLPIMLAMSPIMLAYVPTLVVLGYALKQSALVQRCRSLTVTSITLLAQLWATLVLWLATNSGFMGASC